MSSLESIKKLILNGQIRSARSAVHDFCYDLAKAWLDIGQVNDAIQAINHIPNEYIDNNIDYFNLKELILQSKEADEIGFAAYPDNIKMNERWKDPIALPKNNICSWAPGRIVSFNNTHITIHYVKRTTEKSYRGFIVLETKINIDKCEKINFTKFEEGVFIELGYYQGDSIKIARL